MSKLSTDKSRAGQDMLNNTYHADDTEQLNKLASFCPDYFNLIQDLGLGNIWQRPGLTLREKELIVFASLITQGDTELQLRQHVHTAFKRDLKQDDILECIILLTVYVGVPRTLNAIETVLDELEQHK